MNIHAHPQINTLVTPLSKLIIVFDIDSISSFELVLNNFDDISGCI